MREQGTALCHRVEVGRFGRAIQPVGSNEIPAELVCKVQDDIWLSLWSFSLPRLSF
jgi:hypothetical protein